MMPILAPALAGIAALSAPVAPLPATSPAMQNVAPAPADRGSARDEAHGPAAGVDVSYSFDADDTEVLKLGANFDLRYASPESYVGVRVERVRFNPIGQGWQQSERAYLRVADTLGDWKLNVRAGSDGQTLLGAATIHNEARFRQEYFVEREIVETPQGLARGIYYTFAGAAIDLPFDDRNQLTLVGGVQDFTGDNVRTHARATFVHVLKSAWGLSAQLRTRYFRNSDPREFDYYSPRWHAEILPVLQLRRFVGGWRYAAAAGLGQQRDSESGWRASRYLNLQATSPANDRDWAFNAGLTYSNTPVASGITYSYFQMNFGVTKAF